MSWVFGKLLYVSAPFSAMAYVSGVFRVCAYARCLIYLYDMLWRRVFPYYGMFGRVTVLSYRIKRINLGITD